MENNPAPVVEASAQPAENIQETADIQDAVHAAVTDPESESSSEGDVIEEAVQEYKKKLKLKVDGQEIEEELDWNDEDRLKRALQKEKAFDKRSQEFASLQKNVEGLFSSLKGNTFETLRKLGVDVDSLILEHVQREVEESEKDPETKEREKMQKELEELRKEKERIAKEKEEAEFEKIKNQKAQEIQTEILSALDASDTVLPKKNPWVLRKVAEAMYFAAQNGYPEVKVSDVIPLVEKQFKTDLQSMFDVLPEEVLEQVVGKNNFDRVRKKRVASRKVTPSPIKQTVTQTNNQPSENSDSKEKTKSYKDMFDPRF